MMYEYRTFRVRGIPPSYDEQQLGRALKNNFVQYDGVLDKDLSGKQTESTFLVKSLASSLHSHDQEATVQITNITPAKLNSLRKANEQYYFSYSEPMSQIPISSRHGMPDDHVTLAIDFHFRGLTIVYSPPVDLHRFDILALSGDHAYNSFVDPQTGHMWLGDALKSRIPSARIILYGCDIAPHNVRKSLSSLDGLASSLQSGIGQLGSNLGYGTPLIILGHGFGGLVAKEAMIRMAQSDYDSKRLESIIGLILFGVPNDGIDPVAPVPMGGHERNRSLLESLSYASPSVLLSQKRQFADIINRWCIDVFCFYETLQSEIIVSDQDSYSSRCLVSERSATSCLPGEWLRNHALSLNRTHANLVKFKPHDEEFEKVVTILNEIIVRELRTTAEVRADEEFEAPDYSVSYFEDACNRLQGRLTQLSISETQELSRCATPASTEDINLSSTLGSAVGGRLARMVRITLLSQKLEECQKLAVELCGEEVYEFN